LNGAPPDYSSYKRITNPLVDALIRGFSPRALLALETWRTGPSRCINAAYRVCWLSIPSDPPSLPLSGALFGPWTEALRLPLSARRSREMDQLHGAADDGGDGGQPPKKKLSQAQIEARRDALKRARAKKKRKGGSGISRHIDGAKQKCGSRKSQRNEIFRCECE